MQNQGNFREPTETERFLFARLLEAEFPGRNELALLLSGIRVKTIDDDGGLELHSEVDGKASVNQRIPVQAEGKDQDGVTIHLLLHVVDGRPIELEFFREDAQTVKKLPPASSFELIVLPPAPRNGWKG
jgi:hypothetical protein